MLASIKNTFSFWPDLSKKSTDTFVPVVAKTLEGIDFEIRINTRIDSPEEVVEDTIIHEMIHYFIFYHNLHDTSAHGNIFISIMQSINANFGRNLSILKINYIDKDEALSHLSKAHELIISNNQVINKP